jgi:uncharacterized membrane protein
LFLRELALPFVLVALVLAWREKRWREVGAWCAGLAAFGVFFTWHAWQVQRHLTGLEFAEHDGWLQLGGPVFVIRTCQMNLWLFKLPGWIALIYLVMCLLGFARSQETIGHLIGSTVFVYLLTFLIVGKPFNEYWGLLYVALLPWGLVRFPQAAHQVLSPKQRLFTCR